MTTYYVDPVNGNDANDGLSWGTAYKTLLNGPSFARLGQTDSDEIRIAKSPDPVSLSGTVVWTHNSDTITFTDCSNLVVDNCDTAWTAGLVTPTAQATYKLEGTNALQAVMASTNGKVCYKTLSLTDYSAFSRITFWVNFGTAVNYSASNPVTLTLCSDTAGAVPVVTFTLPRYYYPANYWVPITLSPSSGSFASAIAIQSIALNTTSAVSNTVRLDNISVAKASTDNTALVLTDLIAKDNGNGEYYPPLYISGTTIGIAGYIGQNASSTTTSQRYFSINGTETIATLKRECFVTALDIVATANTAAVNAINYTASTYWPATKTYIGGVNPATNLVDGETWFDGATRYGYGITQTNSPNSSWYVSNISAVRYYVGLATDVGLDMQYDNISLVACDRWLHANTTPGTTTKDTLAKKANINVKWAYVNNTSTTSTNFAVTEYRARSFGVIPTLAVTNYRSTGTIIYGAWIYGGNEGPVFDYISTGTIITTTAAITNVKPNTKITVNNVLLAAGVAVLNMGHSTTTTAGYADVGITVQCNGTIAATTSGSAITLIGATSDIPVYWFFGPAGIVDMTNITSFVPANTQTGGKVIIRSMQYSNLPASNYILNGSAVGYNSIISLPDYRKTGTNIVCTCVTNLFARGATSTVTFGAYWTSQPTITYSGSSAWQSYYDTNWNLSTGATTCANVLPIGPIVVSAGTAVTITVKANRSATNIAGAFYITGNGIDAPSYVESTSTSSTSTWETLTASFTPSANTTVYVNLRTWAITNSATAMSITFDDLQVTQA